jgi:hypothetical protein
VYERFHAQGFEILAIAFVEGDEKGRTWLADYLDEKGARWTNAPTTPQWYGPPVEAYDVSYLPFNLLLDRDGRVIDMDVRGRALDAAVERALGVGG